MTYWRNMFVGRENDLAVLQDAWKRAKAFEPQVVCLVAESGIGKTRLVQEFFGWLSTTEDGVDGAGYWPDQLTRTDNAQLGREELSVNPEVSNCIADGRDVPFLWWGVGLPNTTGNSNQVTTSLTQYQTRLQIHLLAYVNAIKVAELKGKNRGLAAHAAFDLGVNAAGLTGLAALAIAGAVTGGVALTVLGALKGVGFATSEYLKRRSQIGQIEQVDLTPEGGQAAQRDDIADLILNDLGLVCSTPPEPLEKVPLVVVIDDAQWIKSDLSLCKLLAELVAKAGQEKWPLLILVTSWEGEWRAGAKIDWGSGTRDNIRSVFEAPGINLIEHALQPVAQLNEVVTAAFPGLTDKQRTMILGKADGNSLCLYNVLRQLEESKGLFESRSLENALTAKGEEQIAALTFEQIVRLRLLATPEYVQTALGLASLQGMQFSQQVVAAAAEKIALENAKQGLVEGENPHSFIRSQQGGQSEFRARYYQKAAEERLGNLVDRDEAAAALTSALQSLSVVAQDETISLADDAQRWQAQLALFDRDDIDQRSVAFEALYQLAMQAYQAGDVLAAQAYAKRWAEAWQLGKHNERVHYFAAAIIRYLTDTGQFQLASTLGESVLESIRGDIDSACHQHARLHLRDVALTAGDAAKAIGHHDLALTYFNDGMAISVEMLNEEQTADNLLYASLFAERNYDLETRSDSVAALPRLEGVLELKNEIVKLRPDFKAYLGLAIICRKLAEANLSHDCKDDADAYIDKLLPMIEKLRKLAEDIQQKQLLFSEIFSFGDLLRLRSRIAEARVLFLEALKGSWRVAQKLDTPVAHRTVSLVLERLAMLAEAEGDYRTAISYLLPCMDIKEKIAAQSDGLEAIQDQQIIAHKLSTAYAALEDRLRAAKYSLKSADLLTAYQERTCQPKKQQGLMARGAYWLMRSAVVNEEPDGDGIERWAAPVEWNVLEELDISQSTPRNAPCPCGSGEKFKHCHGKLVESAFAQSSPNLLTFPGLRWKSTN